MLIISNIDFMIRKKKKDINILESICNIYKNILEINKKDNESIKNINGIKKELDFCYFIDSKYVYKKSNLEFVNHFIDIDYTYYKFSKDEKKLCDIIHKYSNLDKDLIIFNYNLKKNINKQFNYFIIKYENFTTKFYREIDNYCLYENGILNYDDFFMLIKDSNCIPFWNEQCEKLSKEIFIPIDSNLVISTKPNTFNYDNWFGVEFKKIKNDNLNNKKLEIDNKERKFISQYKNKKTGEIKNIKKSHKIKIYFNPTQKIHIKRLFGIYRYFYNRTINYINNYDKKTNKTFYFIDSKNKNKKNKITINLDKEKNKFTVITIRKFIKNNYPKWIEEINFPSHLFDMAIKEAVSAYNGCMVKFNKYKIAFDLKLKTKKDKMQTMNLEKTMIHSKTNSLFYNLKNIDTDTDKDKDKDKYTFRNLKTSCKINKYLNIRDSSISWNQRTNEYYLNINFDNLEIPNKNILLNKKICAIDPGIKSFLSIYSDDSMNKIGIGIRDKIEKICRDIDIIISKQYRKKNGKYKYAYQKRRSLRKALHKKIKYLDNLKEELHNKSIKYLCDNYGKIIIPPFETQKMVSNIKLDSKTSRNLMCISYYKFLSKLKLRCIEYDMDLVIRPEYYTSKTCTKCGNIKHNLSNDDVYKCKQCGLKIDRDTNGARNILLRNLCN